MIYRRGWCPLPSCGRPWRATRCLARNAVGRGNVRHAFTPRLVPHIMPGVQSLAAGPVPKLVPKIQLPLHDAPTSSLFTLSILFVHNNSAMLPGSGLDVKLRVRPDCGSGSTRGERAWRPRRDDACLRAVREVSREGTGRANDRGGRFGVRYGRRSGRHPRRCLIGAARLTRCRESKPRRHRAFRS